MSKGVQIAAGAVTVALLIGVYAWSSLDDAGYRYYQTLSEFQTSGSREPARVHGYVAEGSIERDLERRSVVFAVRETPPHGGAPAGSLLRVRFESLDTPDLFKDGAEVVVEGRLGPAGEPVFVATKVFAKCPSKFQAEELERAGL